MRIQIYASKFALTKSLKDYAERRLQFAFGWARATVKKVTLRLTDLNGPKGGHDKSCGIQIPLSGRKSLYVEEVQTDLYTAIDRAVDRAGHVLSRQIERTRAPNRSRKFKMLTGDA